MEDQCSPLSWGYCYQEEGKEELKDSLLYSTLELETTILLAKEEITRREYELIHLKDLLGKTIKERDEAKTKCQMMMLDKFSLQQQLLLKHHPKEDALLSAGTSSSSEDESKAGDSNRHFPTSVCKENVILSLGTVGQTHPGQPLPPPPPPPPLLPPPQASALKLAAERPLPKKGKLLQAVKEAGPLLQTLLLAGPLPQWQHPPPQLNSIDIPPVAISSPTPCLIHQDSLTNISAGLGKKRGLEISEGPDSSPNYSKFQKICSPLKYS